MVGLKIWRSIRISGDDMVINVRRKKEFKILKIVESKYFEKTIKKIENLYKII